MVYGRFRMPSHTTLRLLPITVLGGRVTSLVFFSVSLRFVIGLGLEPKRINDKLFATRSDLSVDKQCPQ
jgi:hypothetical protein